MSLYKQYQDAYEGKLGATSVFWTRKIYDLAAYRQAHSKAYFAILSWGTSAQVEVLSKDTSKVIEFQNAAPLVDLNKIKIIAAAERTEFFIVVPSKEMMPADSAFRKPVSDVLSYIDRGQLKVELVDEINENAKNIYSIYKVL